MAKKKSLDVNSFEGMFKGTGVEEQVIEKNDSETLGSNKEIFTITEMKEKETVTEIKRKGRPKLNRETKKRYSFTILPSLHKQASEIAYSEGTSLSEVIENFLTEYVKKHE